MKTFFACDERIKLNSVFEEAAVLACERVIWPTQFKCDELAAFKSSLQRMCCHITSGKYREYCWENYDNVLKMFVPGLITTKFKKGLDNGKIRRS